MLTIIFLQALAMGVTAMLVPRLKITGVSGPVLMVVALTAINSTVWDNGLFFQIPDSFSLQTLRVLVCNGVIFWVLVKLLPGIEIQGLLPAIVAPVVFTIASGVVTLYGKDVNWAQVAEGLAQETIRIRDSLKSGQEQTAPKEGNHGL